MPSSRFLERDLLFRTIISLGFVSCINCTSSVSSFRANFVVASFDAGTTVVAGILLCFRVSAVNSSSLLPSGPYDVMGIDCTEASESSLRKSVLFSSDLSSDGVSRSALLLSPEVTAEIKKKICCYFCRNIRVKLENFIINLH